MDFAKKPNVALVTFTDDREEGLASEKIINYMKTKQLELHNFLRKSGFNVFSVLEKMDISKDHYGLRSNLEVREASDLIQSKNIESIVIGCWNWTPPMLVIEFVRKVNKPILFFTENNPVYGGIVQMSAVTSSLMEQGINKNAIKHERVLSDKSKIIPWVRAVTAISRLKESAALLWGGSYSLKMEHLQDDIPKLKTFFIRDIINEDQYVLIHKAELILRTQNKRIRYFNKWLRDNKAKIKYDEKMCTPESLDRQVALLLAARDRLSEMQNENIGGVSIKCQPEIYSIYGVDACTLPAFLPFPFNEEGNQKVYPTVCEGDIKGLLTSMLLYAINPSIPPVFGDFLAIDKDYIEFANCGASSIFWSSNSSDPKKAISNLEIKGNCHGNSGASFGYYGKQSESLTLARLTRINGKYYLQVGEGYAYDAKKILKEKLGNNLNNHLGSTWGKIVININSDPDIFLKIVGANHLSATLGNHLQTIKIACRELGIQLLKLDDNDKVMQLYESIRT